MIEIALLRPEIPPNTGNIIRLCANMGAKLHLIGPMGFSMEDKQARRAGLDYHDLAQVKHHDSLDRFIETMNAAPMKRLLICTSQGQKCYTEASFSHNDIVMFGPETVKFPDDALTLTPPHQRLRIPMKAASRCLNLSNAVAIVAYEAWRQNGFIEGQ